MGAQIVDMTAEEHDATVALTSHVPQVVSTVLAATLARKDSGRLQEIFGTGLLDMTRLALSDIDIWAGILSSNEQNVKAGLDALIATLIEARNSIGTRQMDEIFGAGSAFAALLRKLPLTS